jgi:hypothetical protein
VISFTTFIIIFRESACSNAFFIRRVTVLLSRMVGTQKWTMEEILWVSTMVKQGLKDEEIYEKFCGIFKNARHVRGASSIKYCRTGFMKQEE